MEEKDELKQNFKEVRITNVPVTQQDLKEDDEKLNFTKIWIR